MRCAIWRGAFLSLISRPALKRVKPTRWAKPRNELTVARRTAEPSSLVRMASRGGLCVLHGRLAQAAAGRCKGAQETLSHVAVDPDRTRRAIRVATSECAGRLGEDEDEGLARIQ